MSEVYAYRHRMSMLYNHVPAYDAQTPNNVFSVQNISCNPFQGLQAIEPKFTCHVQFLPHGHTKQQINHIYLFTFYLFYLNNRLFLLCSETN